MSATTVRTFRPEDGEAVATARRAAVPYLVCTADSLRWQVAAAPASQRLRRLVAERGGVVAGFADVGLVAGSAQPGQGFAHVTVAPEAAGEGAGGALAAAAEAYLAGLGASHAHTWVADDGRALRFAQARGYVRSRLARFLGLDLARAPLPALPDPLPAGLALRTAADFGADLRPLYEADVECAADEPGDVRTEPEPYEEWLRANWARPDWNAELSGVLLVDGRVAAYSVAQTDGADRCWSGMTGTRRRFRGRGLAGLAKLSTLLRVRAAGFAFAYTGNDDTNAPMLALNRRLGYTEAGRQWRCVKRL